MSSNSTAPYYDLRDLRRHESSNGQNYGASDEEMKDPAAVPDPPALLYSDPPANQSQFGLSDSNATQNQAGGRAQIDQLIQAANSAVEEERDAGGQDSEYESFAEDDGRRRMTSRETELFVQKVLAHAGTPPQPLMGGKRKRKRNASPKPPSLYSEKELEELFGIQSGTKRSKLTPPKVPHDPALENSPISPSKAKSNSTPHGHPNTFSDARAGVVHSAAALFRRPSASTAKKHTRPPMSRLFMSLQLSPENFLHLQAAAKAYMLDPAFPDRQNCVGNRGKGDTDMVKLRLFNCVNEFLQNGLGEQFFGENLPATSATDASDAAVALGEAEAPPPRQWIWPRDATKIITLVTPLLRRMVTNERQRQYAIESRKGGTSKKDDACREASLEQEAEVVYNQGATPPPPPAALENALTLVILREGRKLCPTIIRINKDDSGAMCPMTLSEIQAEIQKILWKERVVKQSADRAKKAAYAEALHKANSAADDPPMDGDRPATRGMSSFGGPLRSVADEMVRIRQAAQQALDEAASAKSLAEEAAQRQTGVEKVIADAAAAAFFPERDGNGERQQGKVTSPVQDVSEVATQMSQNERPALTSEDGLDEADIEMDGEPHDNGQPVTMTFRVLTPTSGYVGVTDEEGWENAKADIQRDLGMEGVVRLVCELS